MGRPVPARRARAAAVRVAVSAGDPSGVGPEVSVAAAAAVAREGIAAYLFGDAGQLERLSRRAGLRLPAVSPGDPLPPGGARVGVTRLAARDLRPGRPTLGGARAQLAWLEAALACVLSGEADALCTAPVSKAQVARVLPGFRGHTEWLAERTGAPRGVMMLAGPRLRVALATSHAPLSRVRRLLSPGRIAETADVAAAALRRDFGIASPRLAVCALNPHAGDRGEIGDEERRLVAPAVARARRSGVDAAGPLPADSVFFRAARGEFDAVVALYHDQGLIPVKLLDALLGETAVNVTLGLPLVRTSPDHGVAYDLAGRDRASPASMVASLRLAARIARRRRERRRGGGGGRAVVRRGTGSG